VPGRHDARGGVHVDPDVLRWVEVRLAGMDPHADRDRAAVQSSRRLAHGVHRPACGREREEERVSLVVDFVAAVAAERLAHGAAVLGERVAVSGLPQPGENLRRALDVGEHERDGAGRLSHRGHGRDYGVKHDHVEMDPASRAFPGCSRSVAPVAVVVAWLLVVGSASAAVPAPPFKECPRIGADSSCAMLILIGDHGTQILTDPAQGPYEHNEGVLVGVLNDTTGRTISSVPVTGDSDVFSFDVDGICDPKNSNSPFAPGPPGDGQHNGPCPGNTRDTSGYGGPNSYFTGIDGSLSSGTVNFVNPLKPGESTYFSLEGAVSTAAIDVNVVVVFNDQGIRLIPYEIRRVGGSAESSPLTAIAHTDNLHFVVVNQDNKPQTFTIFGVTTAAIRPGGTVKFDRNPPDEGTFAYGSTLDNRAAFHGVLTVR
jgi:hypothetical protein